MTWLIGAFIAIGYVLVVFLIILIATWYFAHYEDESPSDNDWIFPMATFWPLGLPLFMAVLGVCKFLDILDNFSDSVRERARTRKKAAKKRAEEDKVPNGPGSWKENL